MNVPPLIEDALWAAARRHLPPEVCGGPALTQAVIERSRRYTSERERLAAPMTGRAGAADLAARALFFTIADAAKPWVPLTELADGLLPGPGGFLGGEHLRVLDVGAGCGAMTLGLLVFLARRGLRRSVSVTLIDRDAPALDIAAAALASVALQLELHVTVSVRAGDVDTVAKVTPRSFDLVLAGSVLNELDGDRALALTRGMLAATGLHGAVIVVEPALRETTRALHRVRDALIAGQAATVLAPCTRRAAPCPALADERDWCHDHRPLTLPPRANQLAQVTGLRDGELKLSYLALSPALDLPLSPALRVVTDPRGEKGKQSLTVCGPAGWTPLRLLRRHRSPSNRGFERARRGDLLHITPDPAPRPIGLSDDPTATDEPVATAVVDLAADDQVELLALDRDD